MRVTDHKLIDKVIDFEIMPRIGEIIVLEYEDDEGKWLGDFIVEKIYHGLKEITIIVHLDDSREVK